MALLEPGAGGSQRGCDGVDRRGGIRRGDDGVPVEAISSEDAAEHFAWLARFLAVDSPAWNALTRELMGWQSAHPGLIEDLDQGHYFRKPSAMTVAPRPASAVAFTQR